MMKPGQPDDSGERNPASAARPLPDIDEVIRTQRAFVTRVLLRAGVAERDLPDVEQEVFLVVHRRLAEFEGRCQLRTWLCRIALNFASDYRRRACNRHESLREVAGESHADAACPIERRDTLACVATALDHLSDEKREVFLLHELEELSMHDVARRTRVPLKTAFSRLYCARRELRVLLLREGISLGLMPAWWPRRFWLGRVQGWQVTQSTWLPSLAALAACAVLALPAPPAASHPAAQRARRHAASPRSSAPLTAATSSRPGPPAPSWLPPRPQPAWQPPPKHVRRSELRAAQIPLDARTEEKPLRVYRTSAEDVGPPIQLPFGFEWVDVRSQPALTATGHGFGGGFGGDCTDSVCGGL
jgi:RNA polymerase sigma-70 factor (ECF subfamily)